MYFSSKQCRMPTSVLRSDLVGNWFCIQKNPPRKKTRIAMSSLYSLSLFSTLYPQRPKAGQMRRGSGASSLALQHESSTARRCPSTRSRRPSPATLRPENAGLSARRNAAPDFASRMVRRSGWDYNRRRDLSLKEQTMARKDPGPKVGRRKFLTGVVAAGAATAMTPARAAETAPAPRVPSALPPSMQVAQAETGTPRELARVKGIPGSDFMVDVIKTLAIKYLPANCASSYRAIHESLINYGGNKMPEFLTCMHEESAVGMAHGYFKAAGKPLMTLCHGTVGLQHASMAIYNAWCDRVPVMVVGGNDLDAAHRPPGVPTFHSAQDINALVRDFTKWDDMPVSLQHFAQSFVRAYKIAMTPPYGPVAISLDAGLQQEPMKNHGGAKPSIPRYVPTAPPQGDSGAVKEAARLLAAAQNPVIVADRAARTPEGVKLLVQLAELLPARVIDQGNRMNFPRTHYLSALSNAVNDADVIIGLELSDFWATVNSYTDNAVNEGIGTNATRIKPETKLISISSVELNTKANYQDFQR